MSSPSFDINPNFKKGSERDKKITNAADAGQTNAARILQKKGKGPSLPGRTSDMRRIAREEIKLVDKILGEEKCGKGMYWCKSDNRCKPISSRHGGDMNTNGKGEVDESVTIEDAFGNKFVEFIDLITPESLLSQREEKDHEVSMAHQQIKKSQENLKKIKKSIGKKEKNLPAWMQAKLTDTEHNTDAVAGYNTKESMNLAKADMGDVINDFRNSKKPQFKGKSDKKIRQMAIAAKLEAERQNEEVELEEGVRLPSEFGHLLSVIVSWRGRSQYIRMFFPQAKLPTKKDIQAEIEKVYPGGRVLQFSTSDLPSNHANFDSPLFKVTTKEEVELKEECGKCKKNPCECSKSDDIEIEEKKGLWDNVHARSKEGKPKRKPGDKNYPKTLNVEGKMATARANVGASKCWDGYRAKGTKKKNGKVVPNCVKEDINISGGSVGTIVIGGDLPKK